MLKHILTISAVVGFLLTTSCGNEGSQNKTSTPTTQPETEIVSENKIDVFGTYEGTTAGANSRMKHTLTLNADNTYVMETAYIDKSDKVYTDKGRFKVENGNVVLDIKGAPPTYRIGDKYILQLDMDGKEITGGNADSFEFMKK